ncbi:MAG: hypothetical protein U0175_26470 [Caldilineaceae bacterium]
MKKLEGIPEQNNGDTLRQHYELDYSKAKPNRFAEHLAQEDLMVVIETEADVKLPLTDVRGSEPLASAHGVSSR